MEKSDQLQALAPGNKSRSSSVGIATGYGLDEGGVAVHESRYGPEFSLLDIVQV
jgi:hypothetical protein